MPEIRLKEPDEDLVPLLRRCGNDELDNLVGYITQKGGVSAQLQSTKVYRQNNPDHRKYVDEISAEIQKFGGNTILNLMRGGEGVPYKEVVWNVATRLKVNFNKKQDTDFIEQQILLKVLESSWERMEDDEKRAFLKGILADAKAGKLPDEFPGTLVQAAIIAGSGYVSYKISLIVANAIASLTLKRGVAIVSNMALSRWVAIFAGAVGWGITALWTLFDVAGPAYRVIVPCVLHIAMLRQLYLLKDAGYDPAALEMGVPQTEKERRREILFRKF